MGRYITGDIEGKCGFAVQPSDFADRFGVKGIETHLEYTFSKEDLPEVEAELKRIEDNYSKQFEMINEYFKDKDYYSDEDMCKALNWDKDSLKLYLREYYDYKYGIQIRDFLKEHDYCCFDVEL